MNLLSTRPNRWRPITVFNLLLGLLFSLSALGQPAFLKEGLTQHITFSVNETYNKSPGMTYGLGPNELGRSAVFNGTSSYIEHGFPNTWFHGQNHLTISAWVKPIGDGFIVLSTFGPKNWDGSGTEGQRIGIVAEVGANKIKWETRSGGVGAAGGAGQVQTESLLNKWSHIAWTYDLTAPANNAVIYLNGKPIYSQKTDAATFTAKSQLTYSGGREGFINFDSSGLKDGVFLGSAGEMYSLRIYNRTLNEIEIKSLYNYESTSQDVVPVFVNQPQTQSVISGNDATFCITLKDAATYNYQWQYNEQNIAGATLTCYTINSVTTAMDGGRYRVIVSNSAGTIISDSATLTVVTPPPPSIVTQPAPKTVQEGANVNFNVVATGQGSLVYQWQFNEQNLPGATSATLNLNGVKLNTAGRYRVLVSSQYGVTISDTVTLTVNPNPPPTIVTQPLSRTPAEGTQVSLTVTATGLGSLTYQWQINNQNIPGATSSTLVLSAVRPSMNGNYRVIVDNPYGTTISTEANVTVVVTDSDGDGLSDYEELLVGTNSIKADSDGDGLSDFAEVRTHKSNPLTTDTDGDGYSDGIEVARDGNPNNRSVTPTGALAVFPAVDVEFYTLNGVKYQLEVSTDMVAWTAQGGVVVGNGGSQNHLVRASKATQFWRLKVVQ
jgi:hypothetical protein